MQTEAFKETIKTLRKKVKCTFRPGDMEPLDIGQPHISELYTLANSCFPQKKNRKRLSNLKITIV